MIRSLLILILGAHWATGQSFVLSSSPSVGDHPRFVVASDINGDGKLDLISADAFSNTLTVLTNNGNGTFAFSSAIPVGTYFGSSP